MSFFSRSKQAAIGLFDSGIGGLTVLSALQKTLPHETFIYLGDTARMPYGDKTPEQICHYAYDNTSFLVRREIKLLVVACSTASAVALDHLQRRFKLPILGMIAPGALLAAQRSRSGRIGVLATPATIASRCYERKVLKLRPSATVIGVAAPQLASLIENQSHLEHAHIAHYIADYVAPFKQAQVDTLLLGCTHYPLVEQLIRAQIGEQIALIDPAEACAEAVKRELLRLGLANEQTTQNGDRPPTTARYIVSGALEPFQQQIQRLFEPAPDHLSHLVESTHLTQIERRR